MNSVHRIGVMVAGVATVATMAGALIVQGYASGQQAAADAAAQSAAQAPQAPQIIYVAAVPTAAPVAPAPPQVIHMVVGGSGDDGGSDR